VVEVAEGLVAGRAAAQEVEPVAGLAGAPAVERVVELVEVIRAVEREAEIPVAELEVGIREEEQVVVQGEERAVVLVAAPEVGRAAELEAALAVELAMAMETGMELDQDLQRPSKRLVRMNCKVLSLISILISTH